MLLKLSSYSKSAKTWQEQERDAERAVEYVLSYFKDITQKTRDSMRCFSKSQKNKICVEN